MQCNLKYTKFQRVIRKCEIEYSIISRREVHSLSRSLDGLASFVVINESAGRTGKLHCQFSYLLSDRKESVVEIKFQSLCKVQIHESVAILSRFCSQQNLGS